MIFLSKQKKEIALHLLAFIVAIPFVFDLNTSYFIGKNHFYMILFDDLFVGIILLFISIFFLVLNKKFVINKFELFIVIILFIYSFYLFIGYDLKDRNILKILVYISTFFIFLNNKRFFLSLFDFRKFLKIFFIIVFGLLIFLSALETLLIFYSKTYLVTLLEIFITNEDNFLNNKNYNFDIKPSEEVDSNFETRYRLSTLLSNPITLMMSLSLTYLIFDSIYKKSKLKYLILLLVLLFCYYTYSKLFFIFILILPLLFIKHIYSKKILIFLIIVCLIFGSLFVYLIDLDRIITVIYESRLIFYEQFINQFTFNYLFRYDFNNVPVYINLENVRTGSHSDIIYLIGNYSLFYIILFLILVIPRLNFNNILIYLLVLSLLNGIILTAFVWVILILNNVNENIDSNTY